MPTFCSIASYLGLQLLWPGLFVYPLTKSQGFELRRLTVPTHGVEKERVEAANAVRLLSSKKTNDIGMVCVCVRLG